MSFRNYLDKTRTLNEKIELLKEEAPKSSEEIAKELGISRQAVHKSLKKSMGKIYKFLKSDHKDLSPFEIAVLMSQMFQVDDYIDFITQFPNDIKQEIIDDADEKYLRK